MKKHDFGRADWFPGIVIALAVQVISGRDLVQSVGRAACDLDVQATGA